MATGACTPSSRRPCFPADRFDSAPLTGAKRNWLPSAASGAALSLVRRANGADSDSVTLIQRFESAATRPALANERAQFDAVGQVVLKLNTPWRDGITHLVMSSPGLVQRLAALGPRPRLRPCARRAAPAAALR